MSLRHCIYIIVLFLSAGCSRYFIKDKQDFSHFSLKEQSSQPAATDSIQRFKKVVQAQISRVIGEADDHLTKDGNETTLGNFVCDAIRYECEKKLNQKIDAVLINRGGLRANIAKGKITVGTIFEVMPFENEIVYVQLKGSSLAKFLPLLAERMHPFYGLTVKVDSGKVRSALINGSEFDMEKKYLVVSSDYLFNGGDSFGFLQDAGEVPGYLDVKIRDAIIDYCEELTRKTKTIKPYKDGRLKVSK
jgi:2',3'-cyclic-nucleotide 2'-phosphodiesterase (5'-nucleotidase family)